MNLGGEVDSVLTRFWGCVLVSFWLRFDRTRGLRRAPVRLAPIELAISSKLLRAAREELCDVGRVLPE